MDQSNRPLVALREKTFAFVVAPYADAETIFEAEFFEDVLNVLLHRRGAATEKFADLFVALAVADPSGYFEFARRGRFFLVEKPGLGIEFSRAAIGAGISGGHGSWLLLTLVGYGCNTPKGVD